MDKTNTNTIESMKTTNVGLSVSPQFIRCFFKHESDE